MFQYPRKPVPRKGHASVSHDGASSPSDTDFSLWAGECHSKVSLSSVGVFPWMSSWYSCAPVTGAGLVLRGSGWRLFDAPSYPLRLLVIPLVPGATCSVGVHSDFTRPPSPGCGLHGASLTLCFRITCRSPMCGLALTHRKGI